MVICQPCIFQVASLKRAASTSSATLSNGRGSHSCGGGGKGGSQKSHKSQSQKLKARSATFSEEHLSPGVKIAHVDAREGRADRVAFCKLNWKPPLKVVFKPECLIVCRLL